VLLGLIPSFLVAQTKSLAVPHWHQVYSFQGVDDWSDGQTFSINGGPEKSIRYAACWPTALADVLAYYGAIDPTKTSVGNVIRLTYKALADHDDGAHTADIPAYIAKNWPFLRVAGPIDVSDLGKWPSEEKWQLIKECIDSGWPVLATVSWVRERGKIFNHAIVIRGYVEGDKPVAVLNDPSGGFFLTGKWDETITGERLQVPYDDFYDTKFLVVVREAHLPQLNEIIGRYLNGP